MTAVAGGQRLRRSGWYMATGRWSAGRSPRAVELPCLDGLELPALLPGDVPPERPVRAGSPASLALLGAQRPTEAALADLAGGMWLDAGPVFWLPDGTLASEQQREVAWLSGSWTLVPGERVIARTRFYRAGTAITVATDFSAIELAGDPSGSPALWQTMVLVGPEPAVPLGWVWRCSSKRAALNGHRKVAGAIRAEQRARAVRRGRGGA